MKKLFLSFLLFLAVFPAKAETTSFGDVPPPATAARHAILIEGATGTILFAKDAEVRMPTSSMSKVMTMLLVFEALKKGKLNLETTVKISQTAWSQPGSRTFLKIGQDVKVEDLVRGVIVQSGNDASVALAEAVAGSESSFVALMNEKAREMGLTGSHFMNATGLPDPEHYSTARDLAILAVALIRDFPDYYRYYSEKEFTFNGIKQGNRNPLLYRNVGADGVKTGHTEEAGYGLMFSTVRGGRRIVGVVNGLSSMQQRADEAGKLLDWAYREYDLYRLVKAGEKSGEAKVWLGKAKTVAVAPGRDVFLPLPRMKRDQVKKEMTVNAETQAPVGKDQVMGRIVVSPPVGASLEVPLVAMEEVKRLSFFPRLLAKAKRLLGKE